MCSQNLETIGDHTKGRKVKKECHIEKDMIGDVMINNAYENRNTFPNGIFQ